MIYIFRSIGSTLCSSHGALLPGAFSAYELGAAAAAAAAAAAVPSANEQSRWEAVAALEPIVCVHDQNEFNYIRTFYT